jgi:4-hydroxy-tetrahydrodipicolinate reductase
MQVIVAGTGKLATELLNAPQVGGGSPPMPWSERGEAAGRCIVVHAGSGRALDAIAAFCQATRSPLIELATGSGIEAIAPDFPVVLCANTNILMLKFMGMLERSGHLFQGHPITLVESHQAPKASVPGTAVQLAHALGLETHDIRSVRDPLVQRNELHIPAAHLARHAFHRITIQDGGCSLTLESQVVGDAPYADGVARIVAAVQAHRLENRLYPVMELVHKGWL